MTFNIGDELEVIDSSGSTSYEVGDTERISAISYSLTEPLIMLEGHTAGMFAYRFRKVNNPKDIVNLNNNEGEKTMEKKYYRVIKDIPILEAGAILMKDGTSYVTISDVWNTPAVDPANSKFSAYAIEHAPDWYERVYEISYLGKLVYGTKEAAKAAANKLFKEK